VDLFAIHCMTCHARLKVRDRAAIGRILACPKCASMVQVTPPPGWKDTPPAEGVRAAASPANGRHAMREGAAPPAGRGQVSAVASPPRHAHAAEELLLISTSGVIQVEASASAATSALPAGEGDEPSLTAAAPSAGIATGLASRGGWKWALWGGLPALGTAAAVGISLVVTRPDPAELVPLVSAPATADAAVAPANLPVPRVDAVPSAPAASESPASEPSASGPVGIPQSADDPELADAEAVPANLPPDSPPAESALEETALAASEPVISEASPPAPDVPRYELPTVDVGERLAVRWPRFACRELPLARFLGLVGRLAGVTVSIDTRALAREGVPLDDPVSIELANTTAEDVLAAVLAARNLQAAPVRYLVVVRQHGSAGASPVTSRHPVADLAAGEQAEADLAELVQAMVAPESWGAAARGGRIEADGGALVVEQSSAVTREVERFLAQLRAARAAGASADHVLEPSLESPRRQAAAALARPVTANFIHPTPLGQIAEYLGGLSDTTVVVDWLALSEVRLPPAAEATLRAVEVPLGAALDELAQPLGLSLRALGPRALEITTAEAAETQHEVEFHPAGDLASDAAEGSALAQRLRVELGLPPDGRTGDVRYDPSSRCLIVRGSQALAARVEGHLAAWRREAPR
jgi:hypothetical protein